MQVDNPIEAYQQEQALLQEIRDRFGLMFTDFKGDSRLCMLAALVKLVCMALRGALLGLCMGKSTPTLRHALHWALVLLSGR